GGGDAAAASATTRFSRAACPAGPLAGPAPAVLLRPGPDTASATATPPPAMTAPARIRAAARSRGRPPRGGRRGPGVFGTVPTSSFAYTFVTPTSIALGRDSRGATASRSRGKS